MVTVVNDNRDLSIRWKRLGLNAQQVAEGIGLNDFNALYHFTAGRRELPQGLTRADVEAFLDRVAREKGIDA